MVSSAIDLTAVRAVAVTLSADTLAIELDDGRSIAVPIDWFPRLVHGTPAERADWRFIADGRGIHWPQLDEDISVEHLLAGRRSGESLKSVEKWLASRR